MNRRASDWSPVISIISGGVLCVAGCLLCALALPAFRNYDARKWRAAQQKA